MTLPDTQHDLHQHYDEWLAEHQDELATGWQPEFNTSSGIQVKPVYTPLDLEQRGWDYERELGLPGEEP